MTRRAGCGKSARPDLWEPGEGNFPGPPDWAVQALARPAKEQVTRFPDFVCKTDELALELDARARPVLDGGGLSAEQVAALTALDQHLDSLSGGGDNAEKWTEDALFASPVWDRVRSLARRTLTAFRWKDECPPAAHGYVRG